MVAEKIIVDKSEPEHNHLTISTKLSTVQLICKSPNISSPEGSLKSLRNAIPIKEDKRKNETPITVYFGILQISFGLLMAVFGVLVLVHDASLAQIGGGLWGGCAATLTGVLGVLSAARDCCPLKTNAQRIALTAFLALSLISLAVANLVLVLASIGLARDASKSEEYTEIDNQDEQLVEDEPAFPVNYSALLTGAGLLIISGCECVAAAFSAYHCAKALCPCFRDPTDKDCAECGSTLYAPSSNKDMLVSSWLGKQQPPTPTTGLQPVYVVTTNHRKRTAPMAVAPVYSLPASPPSVLTPTLVPLPLIHAPLGTTPPPLVNAQHHQHPHHVPPRQVPKKRTRYPSDRQLKEQQRMIRQEKPKRQKKKQTPVTTEDVAKTYTGLDRVIAEEFIEICDLTKSGSDTTGCTNSDITSD